MAVIYLPDGSQEYCLEGSEELLRYQKVTGFEAWANTQFPYQLPNDEVYNGDILVALLYLGIWIVTAVLQIIIHGIGVETIQEGGEDRKDMHKKSRKGSLSGIVLQLGGNTVLLIVLWSVGGMPSTVMVAMWSFGSLGCDILCCVHSCLWLRHFDKKVQVDKKLGGSSSEVDEKAMMQGPYED